MSSPKELYETEALQSHWEESATTHSALLAHPHTKDQAKPWKILIDALDDCAKAQRACWLEELSTQAACNQVNYRLDLVTEEFHSAKVNELRAKNKNWKDKEARASAEFTLYFGSLRPFELIRLAIENQIPLMESWPQKLSQEASVELQEYEARFQALLDEGKQSLKARDDARTKTALHRVKEIRGLVDKLNKQRLATYTELLQLAQQNEEAKTWPETFFSKGKPPAGPNREEARGKISAIVGVLESRKIPVSEEERQRISATSDPKVLDQWISSVALVQQTTELFLKTI
jgi:hypothetical protein